MVRWLGHDTSVLTALFSVGRLLHSCYDDSSKFISLLAKPSCIYLDQEDFIPLLQVRSVAWRDRSTKQSSNRIE